MTTSPRSANAEAMPKISRRRIAAALTIAPAVVLTAAPTLARVAGNDEHLFALGRELAAANRLVEDAERRRADVSAVYDRIMPDEPAVLARPDDDIGLKSRPEMQRGKPTGRFYYGPKEIEAAELALLVAKEPGFPLPDNPEAGRKMARLQEIVDLHSEHKAARHAAWIETGVEEAERACEAAHFRCRELRERIAECSALTLPGVLMKARVVAVCFGETAEEVEATIGDLIDDGSGESMAFSIARDLIRLADRNAQGGLHA